MKINGKLCHLWRAVDHEGEVLETVVTAKRDKAAALKSLKRIMKKYGRPRIVVICKAAWLKSQSAMGWLRATEIGAVVCSLPGRRSSVIADDKRLPADRPLGLLAISDSQRGRYRSGGPIGGQLEEGSRGWRKPASIAMGEPLLARELKGEDSLRRWGGQGDFPIADRVTPPHPGGLSWSGPGVPAGSA